jgi:hypothetical protein
MLWNQTVREPKEGDMKNTIRTAALIGAIALVAAIGVTAFASGGGEPATIFPASSSSPSDEPTPSRSPGDDISGPCDEAEHANDPECQGGADDGDNSGPGNGDGGDDDSSGPGNGDGADDDHSGPGHGDDDDDDDHSGPGDGND